MKKIASVFLILMGTVVSAAAQESAVASKRLNFAYTHGSPDYVDLSSLGANVFPAGIDNQMVKARNLKSFVVNFRGWRLLDEYIVDPEFFWELDPIALKGRVRTVNYEKISKYPSLAKRYKAIKPVGVNFVVCVNIDSIAEFESGAASRAASDPVCFRAQSYQMFWGASRSGTPESYPGALLGWYEGISLTGPNGFNESGKGQVPTMKRILSSFVRVGPYSGKTSASKSNTWLDIRWPDEAIDKIYEDYEEYEKEGKDLEKEYKEAKEERKVAKRAQPLAANDEMAQPYEDTPKTAQYYSENGVVGLKSKNGKTTFRSTEHSEGGQFGRDGKFFWFKIKGRDKDRDKGVYHILNASGKKLEVGGYDVFAYVLADGEGVFVDTDELLRTSKVTYGTRGHSNYFPIGELSKHIGWEETLIQEIRSGVVRRKEIEPGHTRPRWLKALKLRVDGNFKLVAKEDWFFTINQ